MRAIISSLVLGVVSFLFQRLLVHLGVPLDAWAMQLAERIGVAKSLIDGYWFGLSLSGLFACILTVIIYFSSTVRCQISIICSRVRFYVSSKYKPKIDVEFGVSGELLFGRNSFQIKRVSNNWNSIIVCGCREGIPTFLLRTFIGKRRMIGFMSNEFSFRGHTTSERLAMERYDFYRFKNFYWMFKDEESRELVQCISQMGRESCYNIFNVDVFLPQGKRSNFVNLQVGSHVKLFVDNNGSGYCVDIDLNLLKFDWARFKLLGGFIYIFGRLQGAQSRSLGVQRCWCDGKVDLKFGGGEDGLVRPKGNGVFSHHVNDIGECNSGYLWVVGTGNEAVVAKFNRYGEVQTEFGNDGYRQVDAGGRSTGELINVLDRRVEIVGEVSLQQSQSCYFLCLDKDNAENISYVVNKTDTDDRVVDASFYHNNCFIAFLRDQGSTRSQSAIVKVVL